MKRWGIKKAAALLLLAGCLCFLAGFELLPDVELSYKKPLIDLYGNTSEESPFNFTEEVNNLEDEPEETESREIKERYIIGVKNKTITLNGGECSLSEMADNISRRASVGSEVLLWDNYAEYHTYVAVQEKLMELKGKKRFVLRERVLGEAP